MNRRGFLGSLAGAAAVIPLTKDASPRPLQVFELPTPCDLSYSSFEYALDIGREKGLGRPKSMTIGPENKFVALELLEVPPGSQQLTGSDSFMFEVVYYMPHRKWQVFFEKGIVESQGPN